MYLIKKSFKFSAAHILDSSYSKECQVIHGHNYTVEVFLIREDLNPDGMVEDFKLLKEEIKPMIDAFDHTLIMSKSHFEVSYAATNNDLVVLPYNPTAENMAYYFWERIVELNLNPEIKIQKVRVWETENNYAEYYSQHAQVIKPVIGECVHCNSRCE